jgi:hypothetical protein
MKLGSNLARKTSRVSCTSEMAYRREILSVSPLPERLTGRGTHGSSRRADQAVGLHPISRTGLMLACEVEQVRSTNVTRHYGIRATTAGHLRSSHQARIPPAYTFGSQNSKLPAIRKRYDDLVIRCASSQNARTCPYQDLRLSLQRNSPIRLRRLCSLYRLCRLDRLNSLPIRYVVRGTVAREPVIRVRCLPRFASVCVSISVCRDMERPFCGGLGEILGWGCGRGPSGYIMAKVLLVAPYQYYCVKQRLATRHVPFFCPDSVMVAVQDSLDC